MVADDAVTDGVVLEPLPVTTVPTEVVWSTVFHDDATAPHSFEPVQLTAMVFVPEAGFTRPKQTTVPIVPSCVIATPLYVAESEPLLFV